MKTHQLLRCIFPDVLADYFDVVDIQESVSQFDFWLDERNFMEKSDHKLGTVSSYGFTSERVIQDFPLRGKAVYLHVRRRKWRDSSNGEIFTYSYDDLTAEGSRLSPEFVSFFIQDSKTRKSENYGVSPKTQLQVYPLKRIIS